MSQHLYRCFDRDGALLYVGVTFDPTARFKYHSAHRIWWDEVAQLRLELHPDRPSVLRAEREAIQRESPRYNVVHNGGRRVAVTTQAAHLIASRASGIAQSCNLTLYPELECSACVDVLDDDVEPFGYYVQYLRRHHPEWLEADAVPILWSVEDLTHGVAETAPFQMLWKGTYPGLEDFLTFYTWPTDQAGEPIDWLKLPVLNNRFPAFVKALDWTPAPLQPTAPLKTILAGRLPGMQHRNPRPVAGGKGEAHGAHS